MLSVWNDILKDNVVCLLGNQDTTPTSLCLYSIGFETDGDLPDGNLLSVCVLFTLALTWVVYWQCDVCPWPFSYISHGEVGVFSLGLMAMQS